MGRVVTPLRRIFHEVLGGLVATGDVDSIVPVESEIGWKVDDDVLVALFILERGHPDHVESRTGDDEEGQ
jgi:hypothetical protein